MSIRLQAQEPQTVIFRTNFENPVSIDDTLKITGTDTTASVPNSFDTDIPNYLAHLGEWAFQVENVNNPVDDPVKIITMTDAWGDTTNQVLRFRIETGDTTGAARVQVQIQHDPAYHDENDSIMYQNGLKFFRITQNIYIPTDFEWMLSKEEESNEYTFLTLAEFFNTQENDTYVIDEDFRLGIELHKPENARYFTFAIDGDTYDGSAGSGWGGDDYYHVPDEPERITIGKSGTTEDDLELGKWFAFDLTIKEGRDTTGRVILKLKQDGVSHDAIDYTNNTQALGDPPIMTVSISYTL